MRINFPCLVSCDLFENRHIDIDGIFICTLYQQCHHQNLHVTYDCIKCCLCYQQIQLCGWMFNKLHIMKECTNATNLQLYMYMYMQPVKCMNKNMASLQTPDKTFAKFASMCPNQMSLFSLFSNHADMFSQSKLQTANKWLHLHPVTLTIVMYLYCQCSIDSNLQVYYEHLFLSSNIGANNVN